LIQRHLDAADIAVLVHRAPDGGVAEPRQLRTERLVLITADLEQERTATAQESSSVGHDATENVSAVATAVIRERRLQREGGTG
jgi:hypothetical protein